ncbi:MAG TPA: asparagine synthase (glutamine-hydrolyzing) [Ruminococcaceae bacterium]|nr:asparagine synthase (glutamine-hydrolyzing) [Oscillospiraceae bacterium]
MSAIAGEISFTSSLNKRLEEFEEMKKSLLHRGKDIQVSYINSNAAIIQNSNEATELPVGPLPYCVTADEKKYIIALDGMLFNKKQTIEILRNRGCVLNSYSDYEIILKGYLTLGENILSVINGVYAFVIWDNANKRLFFARDRLGVKPFFYSNINSNFIFASEIKGLLESTEIKAEIDFNSIMEIILIGPGRTLGCGVFKNIEELKPAYCGTFSQDGLKIHKYWSVKAQEHIDSFEETVEKVNFLVTDSITQQAQSYVPICTMLSGGLDSSIITAVTSRILNEKGKSLKTFSVTYTDNDKYFKENRFQPESDSKYIEIMKNKMDIENEIIEIKTEDLIKANYDAVDLRDLPGMADVDSALLLFCNEIGKQFSVTLSGECSDEIFGGYPWYRDPKLNSIQSFPWAHSVDYRKSLIIDDILGDFNAEDYVYQKYISTVNETPKLFGFDADERKKELMKLNLDWFMMTLVDRTDRMCQPASLDVRVPFCDYRIVEYLYNVKWEYKDYKGYEKGLLREAFKDYLPEEVLWRKKSPFPKTHNPLYLELVRKELSELLEDEAAPIFKFIKKEKLEDLLSQEIPQNFYGQLMTTPQTIAYMLQINYWLNKYIIDIKL